MIGIVTDSNGVLPEQVATRLAPLAALGVVPLHVTVGEVEYREGVDLEADEFYRLLAAEPAPAVGSSQPSPGAFLAAYRTQAERGATEILSIHIGSELSGTLNAARVAAQRSPVPVRLVDSHSASFGVAFAVWAAAESVAAGASAAEAEARALDVIGRLRNVFVIRALDLAAAGGRLRVSADAAGDELIPVLSLCGGVVTVVDRVATVEQAACAMAEQVRAAGPGLRVAIGIADPAAAPLWQALDADLAGHSGIDELVHYRIGPSVGAHLGPGTAAVLYLPWTAPA
jgi:fatty acid kinase fatty acid binding subunit